MKKMLLVAAVFVAALLAISIANAQFGGVKLPGAAGDVQSDVKDVNYKQCEDFASTHRDNVKYNSLNFPGVVNSDKDFKLVKVSTDWKTSNDKYDKERKRWEAEYTFRGMCKMRIGCDSNNCQTMYCSR